MTLTAHDATTTTFVAPVDLPVPLTRFVGRERELADLARLVDGTRLLTLTGAGGSGKTRLAREVAPHIASRFRRVVWVDLAPVPDPIFLCERLAAAMQVNERERDPLEAVLEAVGDAAVLLVLDNCEHLVDACADLAERLLRACPRLVILATSREALGVTSETAWLVPPLACPEAVQLFVDRAQAASPGFTLTDANAAAIGEICHRLDGLPLAIELAAARVRVLPPEQIAARLDDAFRLLTAGSRTALPRHRTLRATMEWSHALLGAREQALLRRLAVFAGGFSLEAAEAVCAGAPLESEDILDGIAALVDKSLVVMAADEGEARYRLLETVRQYGLERLGEAGERERYERRHAEWFLDVIERADPLLLGGEEVPGTIARLAVDDDNLRAAARWTLRVADDATCALRFAGAIFWYWYGAAMRFPRSPYREGRRFLEKVLDRGRDGPPPLRARALTSRGLLGLAMGDYASGAEAFREALRLVRGYGDPPHEALVLSKLAATHLMSGNLVEARALLEEAERIVEPMPRSMLHAFVWFWYGWTAQAAGDLATARRLAGQHVALGEALGHRTIQGHSHAVSGGLELADGDPDAAYRHFAAALPFHIELGDAWGLMLDIEGLAEVAAARRRYAESVRLLGASDALRERTAIVVPATARAQRDALVEKLNAKLGADAVARLLADGRAMPLDEIVRLATDDALAPAGRTAEFPAVAVTAVVTDGADAAVAPPVVVPPGAPGVPSVVPPGIATGVSSGVASGGEPASRASRGVEQPTLRVLALGPLQVLVGGRPVEPAAWGSARPRELLVHLLCHPEGRTKEQVGLAFWPDASPAQLRNNFHVTLHRLRKALGNADWVTLAGDRYRILPEVVGEFDAAVFEQEVVAARRALGRQQEGATHLLEQALARYRGDFLDGEPAGDWHLEHRDRLQLLYVEGLMALGDQLAREERHARAIEAYRRVLARDELHEEALRALMQCHAAAGERTQALRLYQRFAERMRRELGSAPGGATVALHERLQRGA